MTEPALKRVTVSDLVSQVVTRFSSRGIGGHVARGAGQTVLVTGTGAAISFGLQFVLARVLGVEAFGVYVVALSWLAMAQLFGKLELDTTAVRFVGSYVAAEQWGLLRGFLRTGRAVVLGGCLVLAIAGFIAIELAPGAISEKHPGLPASLLVICAMLPVMGLLLFEVAVLQGLQRYAQAQLPQNLIRPAVFAGLVLTLWATSAIRFTPRLALTLNMTGAVVALLITMRWRARMLPAAVHSARVEHDRPRWVRTALPLFSISLAQGVLSQQADILVVGLFLSVTDAGIYGAASTLTLPLIMAATSITFVAQPMIADLYGRGDPARLQSLVRAVTWVTVAVVVPIGAALMLGGGLLLRLGYGREFVSGHGVLVLLTLSQLVVAIVGALAGFLMTMTAHERPAAWIIGLSAMLYVVLAFLLTPRYGAIGTAGATLTSTTVRAIALSTYVRRVMGLRVPAL